MHINIDNIKITMDINKDINIISMDTNIDNVSYLGYQLWLDFEIFRINSSIIDIMMSKHMENFDITMNINKDMININMGINMDKVDIININKDINMKNVSHLSYPFW